MIDRTATDTIKGYFYQFDLTILKLLELEEESDEITVEGIEDIDIKNATEEVAVQCKYHSKIEYNHSVISKSIRFMLSHFKEVLDGKQKRIKYLYFGHFKTGQEKLTLPLQLDVFKSNFLTFKREGIEYRLYEDLNLTDDELLDFISVLEIEINAKTYEEQLVQILNLFKKQDLFKCDDFEAENFYYNNALKIVSNLAMQERIDLRKITKKDFLLNINSKQLLFHKWFVQYKSKKKLLADLRAKYFSEYNDSPFERFFFIEVDRKNYIRSDVKSTIQLITRKYSQLSKRNPDSFCPYIIIYGISIIELIEIKKELINEDFKFKDGFDFNGSDFNPFSIVEKANFYNGIKIKIIDDIRYVESIFNVVRKTKIVYQFYLNTPFFLTTNLSVKHIQIQIEEINDIKNII